MSQTVRYHLKLCNRGNAGDYGNLSPLVSYSQSLVGTSSSGFCQVGACKATGRKMNPISWWFSLVQDLKLKWRSWSNWQLATLLLIYLLIIHRRSFLQQRFPMLGENLRTRHDISKTSFSTRRKKFFWVRFLIKDSIRLHTVRCCVRGR
jgi:hypothetical protein